MASPPTKSPTIWTVGLVGSLLIVAIYPIFLACVAITGFVEQCSPGAWFCGLLGIYFVPPLFIILTGLAFKRMGVKRWETVTAVPAIALFGFYTAYSRASGALEVSGETIWAAFAVAGYVLYTATYAAVAPDRLALALGWLRRQKSGRRGVVLATIALTMAVALPVAVSRTVSAYNADDQQTSSDLNVLENAIFTYATGNHRMPGSLTQLDLSDPAAKPTQSRLANYSLLNAGATYSLCSKYHFLSNGKRLRTDHAYRNFLVLDHGNMCFTYDDPGDSAFAN